jgi:hypothetical protein
MRKLIITVALITLSSSAFARDEQKLYKWADDEGNIYYSDSIPVEFRERPKEILNEHGVTIQNLEGKKTPEQLEQERKENAVRAAQELQQRADLALLQTYLTVDEIEMHRDRRVELFQAQSRVTELYLRNLESRLQKLRNNASRYQPYSTDSGAPMIGDGLAEDLRRTKDTINRHERNLMKYDSDEKLIIERFDGDIARFKILKGIN